MNSTLKEMPDLDNLFYKMTLIDRLRYETSKNYEHDAMAGSIYYAIMDKETKDGDVLKFVYEKAVENPLLMCTIIGEDLTNDILNSY